MHKLTLEHLAPYFPYKLNCKVKNLNNENKATIWRLNSIIIVDWERGNYSLKPILSPLSEYKDINSKSMNNLNTDLEIQIEICDLANKKISFQSLSYGAAIECFANKIDVFGLIEKGLAVEGKETNGNG